MSFSLIAALALSLGAAQAGSRLPPSLDRNLISTCAPATVEAATDCLQRALSPEDVAVLAEQRPGGSYRGPLDALMIEQWQLDRADAPLVLHMRGRDVYLNGYTAAGLVIANLRARLRGRELDWVAVATATRRPAVERAIPVTQEAPDAD